MILLSIIALKDKCIEFTDIVNIVNSQEDVTCPESIRRLLCNFYNIKEEQLVLEDYSPFTNSFVYLLKYEIILGDLENESWKSFNNWW